MGAVETRGKRHCPRHGSSANARHRQYLGREDSGSARQTALMYPAAHRSPPPRSLASAQHPPGVERTVTQNEEPGRAARSREQAGEWRSRRGRGGDRGRALCAPAPNPSAALLLPLQRPRKQAVWNPRVAGVGSAGAAAVTHRPPARLCPRQAEERQ